MAFVMLVLEGWKLPPLPSTALWKDKIISALILFYCRSTAACEWDIFLMAPSTGLCDKKRGGRQENNPATRPFSSAFSLKKGQGGSAVSVCDSDEEKLGK